MGLCLLEARRRGAGDRHRKDQGRRQTWLWVVDSCIVVYLTLRQQQSCGGSESKIAVGFGNSHVEKMERDDKKMASGVGGIDNNGYMGVYVGGEKRAVHHYFAGAT